MKSVADCQKIVTRLEKELPDLIVAGGETYKTDLIAALNQYVDNLDRIGVKSNPVKIVRALVSHGYKSISELTDSEKTSLFLCIIGNFISSEGHPPTNVMWRFSNQFLVESGLPEIE
jgi:hypothetical protein